MTGRKQRNPLDERVFRLEMEDGVIELFAAAVFLHPIHSIEGDREGVDDER